MTVRKNLIAGWASHLVIVLIGFYLMPYTLGAIGEAKYGAWLLINAIAGYSGIVYAGFGATICRYVAHHASRREWRELNQLVSSIQAVYVGTASVVALGAVLVATFAPQLAAWEEVSLAEVRIAILIVGATIALGMIGSVYGGVLIGAQRWDIKRGIEIAVALTRLALTVLCLHQRWGLITLALIFFAVTVVEHACSIYFAYRQIPELRVAPWRVNRNVLRGCLGFSAWNAVALVSEYLIFFTDTVLIGMILGPRAVVPYQIGLRIVQMIQTPVTQIGEVVLPKAGELHARQAHGELSQLVARSMGLACLLSGGFFIGGAYFGDLLIRTWMGGEFPGSSTVLTILLASQVVALPMVVVRKALLGQGQARVTAWIDMIEAVVNLALSLVLIHYWGLIGVAWGTLIPLTIVELFVLLPHSLPHLQLQVRQLLRQTLAPQLPALLALWAFCEFASAWTPDRSWTALLTVTAGGGAILLGVRGLTVLISQRVERLHAARLPSVEATPGGV